jgi:hypothetical protein
MNLKKFSSWNIALFFLVLNSYAENFQKLPIKTVNMRPSNMSTSKRRKLVAKLRNKRGKKRSSSSKASKAFESKISEIPENSQSTSSMPSDNRIQFGYKVLNALLLPSIQYSHLFGYLNLFFNELFITEKDIKKVLRDNESLLILFLSELTTYAKKQLLQENEIAIIAKKIVESMQDQKELPNSFLTENIYQLGVGNFTFEAIASYRAKYKNKSTAALTQLLSNKTIIHDENIGFTALQMQKKNDIKGKTATIEQYANQFYYYITNSKKDREAVALLSTSYLQNVLYAFIMHVYLASEKYKKLLIKHIAKHTKNQSKTEIQNLFIQYAQAAEQAAIIIEKLWQALVTSNAFPPELQEIVMKINEAGGFVTFMTGQIKQTEKQSSPLLPRIIKIAAIGAAVGAGLYLTNKYVGSKPISKTAEFLWDRGRNLFNPITEKISSWWKETDNFTKIWDVMSGSWVRKTFEVPVNLASNIINSKIFSIASEKTQESGGITKFIANAGAFGASMLVKKYIIAKATTFLRQKTGSALYEASLYGTLKDKISNLLYNQNLYYIGIGDFQYLNQSLYLFELIQHAKSMEILISNAKEDNEILKLTSQTGEFLETIFINQLEEERQDKKDAKKKRKMEEQFIEYIRKNPDVVKSAV